MQQHRNLFVRLMILSLGMYWYWFIATITSTVVVAFTAALIPVFTRYAIDRGIVINNFSETLKYALIALITIFITNILRVIADYASARFAYGVSHSLRVEAFNRSIIQPLDFFDGFTVGQFISRITNDSERIASFLREITRFLVGDIMTLASAFYFMFTMSTTLASINIVALVIALYMSFRRALMMKPLIDESRRLIAEVASTASNDLANIKTVKGLNLEDRELQVFSDKAKSLYSTNIRIARIRSIYGTIPSLLVNILTVFVVFYSSVMIVRGSMSIGEMTAFITYLGMFRFPLFRIGNVIADYQLAMISARRLFELIDAVPPSTLAGKNTPLYDIRGEIVFRNVWFSYVKGKPVLKNINLRIKPGEKVVIIGPPGSGKSTLLKLLMRFYEVDSGTITIDGVDIREIDVETLRRNIGYVPQEPYIFNRTIFENIAMDRTWVSLDDVVKAAKIAKIHDFIESLPEKYSTVVGERGLNLSGGQRQRIAIARALAGNPKILLLDDPVANLDAETEKLLVKDLEEVLRGKTAIIATQRISLTRLADRIIVMDDGEIVEEGTHNELLAKRGLYYRMYMSFLGQGDKDAEK